MSTSKQDKKRYEDVLERSKKRRSVAMDAWDETFRRFDKCMRMLDGDQWEEEMINARGANRQRVTVNLLEQPVSQVVNANRQNRPGGKVSAVDNEADPEIASIEEGMIRHVEYNSNADFAYDTAVDYSAGGGMAFIGLTVDYAGYDTNDQELKVRRINDPKNCLMDPGSIEPDGSDMNWFMLRKKLSKTEYEDEYGESALHKSDYDLDWGNSDQWVEDDAVYVAEYWEVKIEKRPLLRIKEAYRQITGKKDIFKDALIDILDKQGVEVTDESLGEMVEFQRMSPTPVVTQYVINGYEVLDETPWKGTSIPFVPVFGAERYVEGKRKLKGVIWDSIQAQEMFNFYKSIQVEAAAMVPKPKWVVPEGADEGYEDDYANANSSTQSVLHYRSTGVNGEQLPPPSWQVFEPNANFFEIGGQEAQALVKATSGLSDAALGTLDPTLRSGKAIQALQAQGQNATSHYAGNLIRSLKRLYRMMIELFPIVYQPDQAIRIIGADQSQKVVTVGQYIAKQNGQGLLDLTTGRYDVTVSAGPQKDSERQEAIELLNQVIASPIGQGPLAPKLIALAIKYQDIGPIGDQMQEVLDPKPASGDAIPPQVQQQMQQLQQQNQELQGQLQQAAQAIQTKQLENQGKMELEKLQFVHDMALEDKKQQTAILVAQGSNNRALGAADIQARLNQIQMQHDANLQDKAQAHEAGLAAMQHSHAQQQADQSHEHGLEAQQQIADQQPEEPESDA